MQRKSASNQSMIVHWDTFIHRLIDVPEPDLIPTVNLSAAKELLDRIQSQNLSARYMFELTDETFETAYQLLDSNPSAHPAIELARMQIDEEAWESLQHKCLRLSASCDPSIGRAFI